LITQSTNTICVGTLVCSNLTVNALVVTWPLWTTVQQGLGNCASLNEKYHWH